MRRGMITLAGQEVATLIEWLETRDIHISELATRLFTADTAVSENHLEISEDTAERVLDALPAPTEIENPVLKSARQKFQTFFDKL